MLILNGLRELPHVFAFIKYEAILNLNLYPSLPKLRLYLQENFS